MADPPSVGHNLTPTHGFAKLDRIETGQDMSLSVRLGV